jgi:hypothetical protein
LEERLFSAAETSAEEGSGTEVQHEATVLYPGSAKGRPTIELRVSPDGSNEANGELKEEARRRKLHDRDYIHNI